MNRILLVTFLSTVAAKSYNAYRTDDAYYFNVGGYGLKATLDDHRRLKIYGPRFSRIWSLPTDADTKHARTFRNGNVFQVVVPRFKTPNLTGGEVPRGTTINFTTDHVCATFDGSEPECGHPCEHGKILKDFVISEDEVIVKLRTCKADVSVETAIFHAFDTDIEVEDSFEHAPEVIGEHGWFDRHGDERPY